jgi:hypothetical protein
VFVHRDPGHVLVLATRLTELLRTPFTTAIDRREIGRKVADYWQDGMPRMVKVADDVSFRCAPDWFTCNIARSSPIQSERSHKFTTRPASSSRKRRGRQCRLKSLGRRTAATAPTVTSPRNSESIRSVSANAPPSISSASASRASYGFRWPRRYLGNKGNPCGSVGFNLGHPARRERLGRGQKMSASTRPVRGRGLLTCLEKPLSQHNREESSMPTTPKPEQPIPVPKPDIVRPPTPLEEPQPEKGPDLPQPGPDVVVPPAPKVITPSQPQEIPSTPPA